MLLRSSRYQGENIYFFPLGSFDSFNTSEKQVLPALKRGKGRNLEIITWELPRRCTGKGSRKLMRGASSYSRMTTCPGLAMEREGG